MDLGTSALTEISQSPSLVSGRILPVFQPPSLNLMENFIHFCHKWSAHKWQILGRNKAVSLSWNLQFTGRNKHKQMHKQNKYKIW